jgi:hypothetical protein
MNPLTLTLHWTLLLTKGGLLPDLFQENAVMMLSMKVEPPRATGSGMSNPYLDAWSRVAGLYKDALEANAQHLFVSSAQIIQEHTMQALVAASRSCAEALAENAAVVQQQSLTRLAGANQRAIEVMSQAFFNAITWRGQPAK